MKIAVLHGARDLRIEEQPLDASSLGPREIWVRTEISALKIGTDRGNYEGAEQVPGAPACPRPVGDSNLGVVCSVGSAVSRVMVGDRIVTRQPHQSEYIINETDSLVRVPSSVPSEDAVYAHLYALSSLCYRKALFRSGEAVGVVGVGVLGMGAVATGRIFGARVVALANSQQRLDMAERMGAHAGFLSDDPALTEKLDHVTGGRGLDLVILTANSWPAYRTAVDVVRPNGRVAIVSLLGRGEAGPEFNPLSMDLFYAKGISLIAVSGAAGDMHPKYDGTLRFSPDDEAALVMSFMADGALEPKRVITHRFHYSRMMEAYEMAYRREKSMLGVIFTWNTDDVIRHNRG